MLRMLKSIQKYDHTEVLIGTRRLDAIVADTFVKRMIGLMFTKRLKPNECMLFTFGNPGRHGIWMRNMLMSIDAIWLDEQGRVVDIRANLMPCERNCEVYHPSGNAMYLLEASAGSIKRYNIKKRERIKIKERR